MSSSAAGSKAEEAEPPKKKIDLSDINVPDDEMTDLSYIERASRFYAAAPDSAEPVRAAAVSAE